MSTVLDMKEFGVANDTPIAQFPELRLRKVDKDAENWLKLMAVAEERCHRAEIASKLVFIASGSKRQCAARSPFARRESETDPTPTVANDS